MALVVKDRVQEITTTTGTGTITLGGAVLGYQSFATVGNGNTTYYTIVDLVTGDWEVGIGTYTASGTTLSRTTVLSSSNAGSLVSFSAGTKNVFVTYPSERSVYLDSPGSYPVQSTFNTLTAADAVLASGTVTATPSTDFDIANKQYVDTVAAEGIHYHEAVYVESPNTAGNLTATYTNGGTNANIIQIANGTDITFFGVSASIGDQFLTSTGNGLLASTPYYIVADLGGNTYQISLTYGGSTVTGLTNGSVTLPSLINPGIGATLTNAGTQVALTIDGILMTTTKRVLIYNQTNGFENGVYTVTTVGNGSTNWVLTRATDADTYSPSSSQALGQGDAFYVTSGNTGAGEVYVVSTNGDIFFGITAINFAQISSAQVYSAGTGLNLSPATTFNISNTGVTAATYGSASQVPVFAVNAQGQITSVTNTSIAIAAGAVSGLAASATTDTTNAANITSGTLPAARLSGSYTGITGVGTLTAGTWNGSVIGPVYGGTGFGTYAVGDLLYADTTTSLAKLADVAVGNALISGGVNSAPSWGKIGLTTHVSGILPVANGGTGNSTGSVANALTINNGGAGAASGATYDGSAIVTISYNTVGASPLAGSSSLTTTGTVTSGTWSGLFGAVSGANLTSLTAGNLSGTIPSSVLGNSTLYVGTTATALNRASASQALTGISSVTFPGSTSGTIQLIPTAVAGTGTVITMPATTGTMALTSDVPTVNNGTLTMNVSGTGLSGSQTFTANQATNATFTVTSNATSANTASTIVARDASGNFSAGTVTAAALGINIAPSYSLDLSSSTSGIIARFKSTSNYGVVVADNSSTTGGGSFSVRQNGTQYGVFGVDGAIQGNTSTDLAIFAETGKSIKLYTNGSPTVKATLDTAGGLTVTGGITGSSFSTSGPIYRTAAGAGYLNGQYSTYETINTSGAIYSIGGAYVPGTTNLGNMYGIGYTYTGGTALGNPASAPSGLWGMYAAAGGVATLFLDASNGRGYFTSTVYSGGVALTGNTGTVTSVATGTGLTGGTITTSGTLSLANTAVTAGSYTSANITVDAQGRITAASSGAGASPGGSTTQVQFNNAGAFGGSSLFTWSGTALTVNTIKIGRGSNNLNGNVVIGSDNSTVMSGTNASNTIVGASAGRVMTSGFNNTAFGSGALYNSTTAVGLTAIGAAALGSCINTNNSNNVGLGSGAGAELTSAIGAGIYNLFAGIDCGLFQNGSYNCIIGVQAGANMSGNFYGTASANDGNVIIGAQALINQLYASTNCTFIGYNANTGWNAAISNSTTLGYAAVVTGNNQVQLGNSSTTTYVYGTVQNRSDARDKTDIRDTQLGLDFIESLRPVDFKWDMREDYIEYEAREPTEDGPPSRAPLKEIRHEKNGSRKRNRYHHGLIAQEVKAVLDAKGIDFGGYQDHSVAGGKDVLSIGYDELVGPLIKAVQELSNQVKALSLELADLKAKSSTSS